MTDGVMRDNASESEWLRELSSDYELLGELGHGAMAVVYRARDRELGRDVAIKLVRPRFAADAEALERLTREARTVASLEHPNIVGLYGIRRLSTGGFALVMQLIRGRTLRRALNEDGAFAVERAVRVLDDISRALAFAHKSGIVHRDVKPENIFLDDLTGRALLSDFGVARSIDEQGSATPTMTIVGTPTYMAPEQLDGRAIDGRSDLYGLGVVGWEMLSGQQPWAGESLYGVIYRQQHDLLPAIDRYRKDVPATLQYLIEGLLHKSVDRRWPSAADFLALLKRESPAPGYREWEASRRRRRRVEAPAPAPAKPSRRGDGEALQTVEFQRSALPNDPAVGADVPVPPVSQPFLQIAAALEEAEALAAPRPRRWRMFGTAAVVLAAVAIGVWSATRGVEKPLPADVANLVPADRAGVDVAVAPAPPPSAPTIVRESAAAVVEPPATPPPTITEPAPKHDTVTRPAAPPPDEKRTASRSDPATKATATTNATADSASRVVVAPPVPAEPAMNFPPERGSLATGGRHSCMVIGAAVWCWGNNERGQLGDGTSDVRVTPVRVLGDFVFTGVGAGVWHSCGIVRAGDVYCWGANDAGQLGDGTTSERVAPVRVTGLFTSGTRVVRAGQSHTCALSRGGEVACWGANTTGQVGTGASSQRATPAIVPLPGLAGALAAGWSHSCALTTDGAAHCWGQNNAGQLGDGTRDARSSPVRVTGGHRFVSIAAGSTHTCALTAAGEVYCWGRIAGNSSTPQRVETRITFSAITSGTVHACALGRDGQAWCWGRNSYGQLGDGTTTDRTEPVRVSETPSFVGVQASGAHSCGVTSTGAAYCWGYNVDGQLGDGTRDSSPSPVRVGASDR
jgi:alpha-tubulin suppressor-like RCC1 family protein